MARRTRNSSNMFILGRARPGTSFDQIANAVNVVGADLVRENPNAVSRAPIQADVAWSGG